MSDQATASNLTRPAQLAQAALQTRLAKSQADQEQKQMQTNELIAGAKALLLNTWETLGIDPDDYKLDGNSRPIWTGSVELADKDATITLATGVSVHDDGLYFRAGDASFHEYSSRRHVSGTLPEQPPSDEKIGNLLLDGWVHAARLLLTQRDDRLKKLLSDASQISNGYTSNSEQALHNLSVAISGLKPGDLPDPYSENLAKVKAALSKAIQRIEADLLQQQTYMEAVKRIKTLAAKWLRRNAAWEDECRELAESLTKHYWQPFTVYKIRYTAIGAPAIHDDYDGEIITTIEDIFTLTSPLAIADPGQGVLVQALYSGGSSYSIVIGAFLDGTVEYQADEPPSPSEEARFYRSRKIGESDFRIHFPPMVSQETVKEFMDMISFPLPPKPFAQSVIDELGVKIDAYNMQYAHCWTNVEPSLVRSDALKLNPAPDEKAEELEVPF